MKDITEAVETSAAYLERTSFARRDSKTAYEAIQLANRGMDLLDATILAAQRLGRTSLTR